MWQLLREALRSSWEVNLIIKEKEAIIKKKNHVIGDFIVIFN